MKAVNNQNVIKNAKGKPKLNNNEIVNEIIVKYLTTKQNNYSKNTMYFKINDSSFRSKFKPFFNLNDGDLKMPIWETESKDHILKVNEQWYGAVLQLIQGETYILDLEFKFYDMENESGNIKGYYAKIPNARPLQAKFDIIPQSDDN